MIKINDLKSKIKLAELTGILDLRSVDNKTNIFELNNSKIRWECKISPVIAIKIPRTSDEKPTASRANNLFIGGVFFCFGIARRKIGDSAE